MLILIFCLSRMKKKLNVKEEESSGFTFKIVPLKRFLYGYSKRDFLFVLYLLIILKLSHISSMLMVIKVPYTQEYVYFDLI